MMISPFPAVFNENIKTALSVGLCSVMLAGCGGGSDSIAAKIITGGQEPIEVSPETFAPPVACPPMELRSNTFLIRNYVRGKQDESEGLLYQATIEDWANSCTREGNGQRRMKVGFSGDVTPGPAWKGGEVTLPLRVAIVPGGSDAEPLSSDLLTIPVTLTEGAPAEKWTLVEEKFTIPQGASVKVVFGFDEGRRR
ncbi:hypothetical protein [uncultured Roseibium sp.]|uniref:hypothetical protein n=1 Tax=uncultured Roseibium sp. TaxID=1936171 RepID=UPI002631F31C|nr:hypothetical protein [uncultured Roseibium sp.]